MQKKLILSLLLLPGLLAACHSGASESSSASKADSTRIETITENRIFRLDVPEKEKFDKNHRYYSDVQLSVQWPETVAGKKATELQQALTKAVFPDDTVSASFAEARQRFFSRPVGFREGTPQTAVGSLPDSSSDTDIRILTKEATADTVYADPKILTYAVSRTGYEGGAHGYASTVYINYDIKNRRVIDTGSLIADKESVLKLITAQLVKDNGLSSPEELESEAVVFSLDGLFVPDNFYPERDAVVFCYNPYEIASWAQGFIRVKIPRKLIRQYFTQYGKNLI